MIFLLRNFKNCESTQSRLIKVIKKSECTVFIKKSI